MCGGAYLGAPDTGGASWSCQSGLQDLPKGARNQRWIKGKSSNGRWKKSARNEERGGSTRSLVEVPTDTVNSSEDLAQAWEYIEFLVDSGALATVVGDDTVRAVGGRRIRIRTQTTA